MMNTKFLYFAAAAANNTTLQKIEKIPKEFWIKAGLGIAGVIVIFIVMQKVLKINKFILGGVIFIGGGITFFNWIYNRTEPKFMTPMVDRIAPFFPSAGAYQVNQTKNPDETEKK